MVISRAWPVALLLVACGGDGGGATDARTDGPGDAPVVDGPPADADLQRPTTLGPTGLCVDEACTAFSPGVIEYAPQYVLFADGATKRRWIQLPAGTQIDTTDMDYWSFPQGTKLWKEFTAPGSGSGSAIRIETRYILKEGSGSTDADWFMMSYAWNADQTVATAAPVGVVDANGTTHDIPDQGLCGQCHAPLKPTRILGFGALSLDYAGSGSGGLLNLDGAIALGMLSTVPPGASSPHYPLPGTAEEQAALGYLHGNCGHCHNPTSGSQNNGESDIQLRLDTLHLGSAGDTPAYTSTINAHGAELMLANADCAPADVEPDGTCPNLTRVVIPGDATHSILYARFHDPGFLGSQQHMPLLSTKTVDPVGDAILKTWIDGLQ